VMKRTCLDYSGNGFHVKDGLVFTSKGIVRPEQIHFVDLRISNHNLRFYSTLIGGIVLLLVLITTRSSLLVLSLALIPFLWAWSEWRTYHRKLAVEVLICGPFGE